ncbi:serine hydrolase domain-containing protein [Oleiagrimonas soli]|uniref:CubicO group peptidase (Beta-lactamase class C family) n=1 Tax=Oleiagrimonas soli TaxID=1543381 RepID=A0A841KLG5_9GAMM|nr:serine hydrolase domain-containing protein [Oleiagrimonas soli]MBB6183501.1 CubicO group peptidase (beta-lactamase class C family) [Oleiagrimonas soli]
MHVCSVVRGIGFRWSLCLVVALGVSTTAAAAPPSAGPDEAYAISLARLDGFAQGLTQAGKFSGVVLVARHGRVLFDKAYGKRDAERSDLATIHTRFNLASAGKMFTTVAILQQIAAGRLSFDTRVGQVLKHYPNRRFADEVTVRELLTHTSGAGDIAQLFGKENAAVRARMHSVADMVALEDHRPPVFKPGSKLVYDNYGYVVLGRMVEVLSGEDFDTYVKRHIFVPADMTHTSFAQCSTHVPDLAVGYTTVDGKRVPNCEVLPNRGFPAGGEVSTARDMYRFVRALESGKLVPPALFAKATKTYRKFMGLGFFATGYGAGVPARDFRWGHGGGAEGICTDVRTYPVTGETIIVLSNRTGPDCFPVANFLHQQYNLDKR